MAADPIERVDRVIERLNDALCCAGFEPMSPELEPGAVAEVERALAPYALPPDLRRLWERVDFWSLPVWGRLPDPLGARLALEIYRQNLDEFPLLFGPPLLFPIARHSGDQLSVELVSRWGPGGAVFSQPTGADSLRLEYASVADLLEVYAELIEEGRFERWDNGRGALSYEDERAKQEARLGDVPREIGAAPAHWPAHWLESAGLDLREREPLGSTHTIAELVSESRHGPIDARIVGKVVRLGGSSDGVLALVSDGDGAVFVFCPVAATVWGPTFGGRYEFDVLVSQPVAAPDATARPHPFDGHSPAAVARAVRPLD